MHPLCDALPVPFVKVRVARVAVVDRTYSYAPTRCKTTEYHRTFISQSVCLSNDIFISVFDGEGLTGFKSRENATLLT